jgi:hypothetical protein
MWVAGRAGTGYFKLLVFESKRLHCDCYILKYPVGSFINCHKDPVEGRRHFRLNIVIWGSAKAFGVVGGRRLCAFDWFWGRVILFRPDLLEHWVGLSNGVRYVLSIGWAI